MLAALRHRGSRLSDVLLGRAPLCIPVGLIAGAGLTIHTMAVPRLVKTFLAQRVVAGAFLGIGTIMPALMIIGPCASGLTGERVSAMKGLTHGLGYRVGGVCLQFWLSK
jgi:hypothetical protein